MRAAEQWAQIEQTLDPAWAEAHIAFTPEGPPEEAAAVLAPLQPGRAGGDLRVHITRSGGGVERARNIFRQLDRRRIWGTLSVLDVAAGETAPAAPAPSPMPPQALAEAWDETLAALPPDWSDLLCELELLSTDYIERAAVLCIQMNPRRDGNRTALRFRAARIAGYGVSPEMARRCLERCDGEEIRGTVRVLHLLSDTKHVQTQGPVWLMSGQTV
jgi:hypothetical protein